MLLSVPDRPISFDFVGQRHIELATGQKVCLCVGGGEAKDDIIYLNAYIYIYNVFIKQINKEY